MYRAPGRWTSRERDRTAAAGGRAAVGVWAGVQRTRALAVQRCDSVACSVDGTGGGSGHTACPAVCLHLVFFPAWKNHYRCTGIDRAREAGEGGRCFSLPVDSRFASIPHTHTAHAPSHPLSPARARDYGLIKHRTPGLARVAAGLRPISENSPGQGSAGAGQRRAGLGRAGLKRAGQRRAGPDRDYL